MPPPDWVVLKFGGTSVSARERWDSVGRIAMGAGVHGFSLFVQADDLIRAYERLPDANPDELNVPDALFIAPRGMVIFDHLRHRLVVVATAPEQAQAEAEAQQAGFRSLVTRGRPHVVYKYAMTLDGKTAAHGEGNGPVSGPEARARGTERVLMLINAPGDGDMTEYDDQEADICLTLTLDQLSRCGLHIDRTALEARVTTPASFNRLFPGSGGALYGRASHGWMASFRRPGARTALKGLYLAGGSVHPGPGVPMATLSGMLAADAFLSDRFSTPSFPAAAISGGMSME